MNPRAYGHAMFALLGLGTADLAVLNLWAIPGLDEPAPEHATTDVSSATNAEASAKPAPAKVPPAAAAPQPRAAAAVVPAQPTAAGTAKPSAAPAVTPATPAAKIVTTDDPATTLLFKRGSWRIASNKRAALQEAVRRLGPDDYIEVDGHADFTGPADVNQRISELRAASVVSLLTKAGVEPSRIRHRAFGESRPSGTGHDRRVEILIRGAP